LGPLQRPQGLDQPTDAQDGVAGVPLGLAGVCPDLVGQLDGLVGGLVHGQVVRAQHQRQEAREEQ